MGSYIETLTHIRSADNRSVYDANGNVHHIVNYNYDSTPPVYISESFYLPSVVSRAEGDDPTNVGAVDAAYDNLGVAYSYYYDMFCLDGMNGNGGAVGALANNLFQLNAITNNGSNTTAYYCGYSAFYVPFTIGDFIYLGTGTGANGWVTSSSTVVNASTGMGAAVDVVGHEYSHGVSYHRAIGALGYSVGENAALNEGLSDVFGLMIKLYNDSWYQNGSTWTMGSSLSAPIRSLSDPKALSNNFADYYPTMDTNADPHYNSTVIGLAYKLLSQGGTHPRQTGKPCITAIGIGVAEAQQVFYRALAIYAPSNCDFQDFKAATATAAYDLGGRNEENAVVFAWDAVGVPYSTYSARAMNVSTRANVGSSPIIAGFILSGGGSKNILLRGIGPTLYNFGITNYISDPQLSLYSGSTSIAANDNWGSDPNATTIISTAASLGAFSLPSGSADAALLPSLSSGAYTLHLSGVGGATGEALVECYDTDSSSGPKFINISTRADVANSSPMIAGFIIEGTANKEILIRGVGPELANYGVSGVLSNPILNLYWTDTNGNSHQIYSNTQWGSAWNASDIASATSTLGAFSLTSGSADSALLVSLPPGSYTAILSSAGNASGNAMVEVYDVR